MKKFIISLFLPVFLLLTLNPVSASITVPERTSDTTWVEDYANVLTPSTEKYIQEFSQKLADDHSACIVVVTMDFVTGSIDDYALALFNQWKIGDANLNNGVLLLLSIGDDDYYMMIGRGLEDDFPIYDIQVLLDDYLEPDFAAKDYDSGVLEVYKQTYEYMEENIYNTTPGGHDYGNDDRREDTFAAIMGFIAIIIAVIFIISILRSIRRARRYYTPYTYYTRPRYRTYSSPFSYRPSTYHGYDRPSSYQSHSSGGGYSSSSHSSGGGSSHSSSHSSSSFGSGHSSGGSSRGAGAGRRH